ncbi:MAG TPA: CHAT domain-containing protein [Solirubrobacteraceae bacterium]|nr:CHAT domain-containing protein [Solirubrobacteraceae bacterium]
MGATTTDPDPLVLAESAFDRVEADATEAARMAERALALARADGLREAEVAALHALSFALSELGDRRAKPTIRSAIRIADRNGLARRAGMARRRLAHLLAGEGAITQALRELDAASAGFDEHELARTYVFRVAVTMIGGRAPPPRAETDRALATLRAADDPLWEARLLRNRGTISAVHGDALAAEADLARACELFASLGVREAAFATELELVRVDLDRGDLPACLARLDAIATTDVSPANAAEIELVRALVLASARLMDEALESLRRAQDTWRRVGFDDFEEQLTIVRLTLLAGDAALARRLASGARARLARRGAEIAHARAVALSLAAAVSLETVRASDIEDARRAAATLQDNGWDQEALRARVTVARAALARHWYGQADAELDATRVLRRRGATADRVEWWHVTALARMERGDRPGALRAARAGLGVLDRHRASLGASELRVTASAIGIELARLGLRMELATGDADAVLRWSERLRANALRLDPVTPPDSPALRDGRRELRAVTAALQRAERDGDLDPALLARQRRLESTIRRRSRHLAGDGTAPVADGLDRQALVRALGGRALVELIELDGELTALVLAHGRLTRHRLGLAEPVHGEHEWLRFALARLGRLPRGAPQASTLRDGAHGSARVLDERLLAPLADRLGDRELVLAPTGSLHALPWALLPSLRGRALTVTPSATIWLARQTSRGRRGRVVLAAGPNLRHARAELNALAELYPHAVTLGGPAARVDAVLSAVDGASVAHLACHGRMRSDSPLFSSLELADGPLNVYELQHLRRAPELVVLSSCHMAMSETHPGDELLGFAAALLNMGTRTVIASTVPVPDAAAKRLMRALHERLVAGETPARALAGAQRLVARGASALTGFVCLGSG